MAGFRIGRGRESHDPGPAQQAQRPGPYEGGYAGPGAPQWQRPSAHGEPEYFGEPAGPAPGGPYPGQGQPHPHAPRGAYTPRPQGDAPGHTQQFGVGESPDAYGPYGTGGGTHGGPGPGPYPPRDPYDDGWHDSGTYQAGAQPPAPPVGPRPHWKELLSGIVLRPNATFWQARDHAVWGPALIVTFVYGLLAVFGFDKARSDVLNATLSNSIPWVLITGVIVVVSGLILGAVTHTLARQLGGDGIWQPTVGLSMLIMSITDAPRLLFAMFLGGDSGFVQLLGWATWLAAGWLFTSMVSKSHDLPWPKALGASSIQLIALLSIIKLGTL
ncbi:Yip1 family protein [Streptomyces gamaensis]|uniref:Yip1 family protein n=1 Tax=Streptomyces gamaensis TaxID=1763542 RepID=A0ABW0YUX4_9ACTN